MSQHGDPTYGGAAVSAGAAPSGWNEKYPEIYSSEPPTDPEAAAGTAISLEGTVQVVKDNMWYIGDAALKSVAEVLYGFGISPTVLGYTEEELMEEEDDEWDAGQQPAVQRDEVVAKTSFSMRSEESTQRRKAEEPQPMPEEEEETYLDQGGDGWGGAEDYGDFGEDKKDK